MTKTLTKMDKASALSLAFCAFVYIICGLVGYWYTEASQYLGDGCNEAHDCENEDEFESDHVHA